MARAVRGKEKVKTPEEKTREDALNWMKKHEDEYEEYLLSLLIRDPKFAATYHGHIGIDPKTEARSLDFRNPLHNAIWYATVRYRETLVNEGTSKNLSVPLAGLRRALNVLTSTDPEPCGIGPERMGQALVEFSRVSKLYAEDYFAYVRITVQDWLGTKRVIREAQSTPVESLVAIEWLTSLNQQVDKIPKKEKKEWKPISMAQAAKSKEAVDICVPTGFHVLDSVLGGGFPKGYASLGAAPQGGGKTVAACQLSRGMAFSGAKGILVTTERSVSYKALANRMISSMGIRYAEFKETDFDSIEQNPKYQDIVRQFHNLTDNLCVIEWPDGETGKDFKSSLRKVIEVGLEYFGGTLDFLMLDWIGAALTEDIRHDMNQQRTLFKLSGEACSSLAADYRIALIAWAQVKLDKGKTQKYVKMADLAECKSIAEQMPIFFGISATSSGMNEDMAEGTNQMAAYDTTQHWTFDKLRSGEAKVIKVEREFEYQRWKFPDKLRSKK